MTLRKSIGLIGIAALLSACIGNRSGLPDYHVLTARATAPASTARTTVAIGVGPVQIAQFLNRPQIVTHAGGVALQLNEPERWGEPLEQGVQRVLMQNIAMLTGLETRSFPWRQTMTPDYAVRINIIDLDKLSDGSALLEVSWALEDLKNARVLKTQQEKFRTPAGASLAEAYSELLVQLAQQVSAQIPAQ